MRLCVCMRMLCSNWIPSLHYLSDLQWLLLAPNPHVFRGLVRNDVQRMERSHAVRFVEDALVCAGVDVAGNWGISPRVCRCELLLGAGARVCVVMSVLRRAEARQDVASVICIWVSGFVSPVFRFNGCGMTMR